MESANQLEAEGLEALSKAIEDLKSEVLAFMERSIVTRIIYVNFVNRLNAAAASVKKIIELNDMKSELDRGANYSDLISQIKDATVQESKSARIEFDAQKAKLDLFDQKTNIWMKFLQRRLDTIGIEAGGEKKAGACF